METTEEKINKMVCDRLQEHQSKMGYNERINIEYFATDCAIEQDRIAREEEREMCIKAAIQAHCRLCPVFNKESMECNLDYDCQERDKIRNIIEKGAKDE